MDTILGPAITNFGKLWTAFVDIHIDTDKLLLQEKSSTDCPCVNKNLEESQNYTGNLSVKLLVSQLLL